MSLLDKLPGYVQDQVRQQVRPMREDLLIIPEAEAAGWVGSFRNESWHNAATFVRGSEHVWATGRDWRRATLSPENRFEKPTVFSAERGALRAALGL